MANRFDYKYPADQCDVKDMAAFEKYREKRLQWIEMLNGDDPHSIFKQIYSVIWDYALFCTVNELRRIAVDSPVDDVGFNGPVIRLFDAGFATTQATAIRRLIEHPDKSKRPQHAVISIRTVLNNIRDNLGLITRENYVCYDGLPYDYGKIRDEAFARLPVNESGVSVGYIPTSGPSGWHMSERMHTNFDRLAQVKPENRSRTDLIKEEILNHLEVQLQPCDKVKTYVDKFIAHGAAPETRSALTVEDCSLTLEKLESCHTVIYRIVSYIYAQLLWESNIGGVPEPQYDHLKGLDMRWASDIGMIKAQEKWYEIKRKVGKWDDVSLWPPGFE